MGLLAWLKRLFRKANKPAPAPVVPAPAPKPEPETPPPAKPVDPCPWMTIAEAEIGVSEKKDPKRVISYHSTTTLNAKDTSTPWCSSFINWVLLMANYHRTKSAWARDWLQYGVACRLERGAIVVFERGAPGGSSHVAFATGRETEDKIEVLGGNQGDAVTRAWYPKSTLLGVRWPVKIG